MFARKTKPTTTADAIVAFNNSLTEAIKAAHDAGLSYDTVATALERRAEGQRVGQATSSRTASTRYDGKTLLPIA
jgi:hypothetical protein